MLPQEKITARLQKIEDEQNSILEKNGELLTAADQSIYDALDSEAKNLRDLAKDFRGPGRQSQPSQPSGSGRISVLPKKLACFSSERTALNFGKWIQAISGNRQAESFLSGEGISIGAMLSDNNTTGGFLVPTEFSADLIRLVEERGVFRRESRVIPMSSDSLNIPRQSSGSTAYFVGEADAITKSDLTLSQINLVLKKVACISSISGELSSDAIISVADMLATDFAYQMASKEDECGFNGDGTSTYGGMTGLRQKLIDQALGGVVAGDVAGTGLVRYGTGHTYANITMAILTELIGKLPTYAEANAKWYGSKIMWSYLLDLLADAGGNTIATISGAIPKSFLGYPYVVTDVMPKESEANQVCLLLGDLRQASALGVGRDGIRIESSNSATVGSTNMFETDQIAIRGLERFDVNVHDVGSATTAGPIVGVIAHTA